VLRGGVPRSALSFLLLIVATVPFAAFLPHPFRSLWLYDVHSCLPIMAPCLLDALLRARDTEAHSDDNRAPPYSAFLIVMTVVVVIAIVVRFWSRALAASEKKLASRYWWDDWMALAAVVSRFSIKAHVEVRMRFGRKGVGLKTTRVAWTGSMSSSSAANIKAALHFGQLRTVLYHGPLWAGPPSRRR
jgi:hypothetical protein